MVQSPLTDKEKRAASRRGTVAAPDGDWLYAGKSIAQWLDTIAADPRQSPKGVRAVEDYAGPEACPNVAALIAAMDDERTYTFACHALGAIGPRAREAVRPLLDAVKVARHPVSEVTTLLCGEFAADLPPMVVSVHENSMRFSAAEAISRIGAPTDVLPELTESVKDRYFAIGRATIAAIGTMGADAAPAVPVLTEALGDDQLCLWAARAIGKIGPAAYSAGPTLATVAKRNQWHESTAAAATAIERISYREGLAVLRGLVNDHYADVRKAAGKAVDRLSRK